MGRDAQNLTYTLLGVALIAGFIVFILRDVIKLAIL